MAKYFTSANHYHMTVRRKVICYFVLFWTHIVWRLGIRHRVRRGGKKLQDLSFQLYIGYIFILIKLDGVLDSYLFSDASPFKIVWVNPEEIQHTTEDHFRHRWVMNGDWDNKTKPLLDTEIANALSNRFIEGCSWEESGYPDIVRAKINNGENAWGCKSNQDIKARCRSLDQLWESLRDEEYKSQRQLIQDNSDNLYFRNTDEIHPALNEIGVDIDRRGKLLWNRLGQHRLIMAHFLELDQIPVQIYRRHQYWQQYRNAIRAKGGEIIVAQDPHPDLRDLV